jgi:long-chain fatty acid transport protein
MFKPDSRKSESNAMHPFKRFFPIRVTLLLLLLTAAWALPASGSEGLYLLGNDTLQIGRADSGTASPRSAYWVLMNPAAIVDLDRRIDTTLYLVREHIQLEPRGFVSNPFDGSLNADGFELIPATGVIWPVENGRDTLGAGLYVIGGGDLAYEEARTWPGKLLYGNRDRKLSLQHYQLPIAWGRRLKNGWAVGAGIQASLTRFRTDQLTLTLRTARADMEWDEAPGIGFNLGVYKRWEKFSFGAMYKSRQWSAKLDNYADLLPAALEYPHMFRAGIAYRPVDRLEFTLDYEFQRWSGVSPFKDRMLESGLHWSDIHGIKGGIEWKMTDRWTLMTGWSHAATAISPNHLYINALLPSIIEDHFTLGISRKLNDRHAIHLAYLRSLENVMRETGKGDLLSRFGKGTEVKVSGDSLALGYTWSF